MIFTPDEKRTALALYKRLKPLIGDSLLKDDEKAVRRCISEAVRGGALSRNIFGLNPVVMSLGTAVIAVEEIGVKRDSVIAIMLYPLDREYQEFGPLVTRILRGLRRIAELYEKNPVIESENFRNLLLSFAEDMRVILIMIADRVNLMRSIRDTSNEQARREVSREAAYLYAPLAHKLGLYKLKSELEDLSLKYLEHDAYYMIREKLSATKQSRDAYIEEFIKPVSKRLEEAGLDFYIKGRTKSIHSIWQKMKKQQCPFEGIYDLFAIRIILRAPENKEKMMCWQAYSIVTDMYQPNPKRLRDWLSVPKSNGYESLHITVLGPKQKWVEVQIRTQRMDEIAERGVAAHWRYKGIKAETGMDEWLTGIRSILETGDATAARDLFRMDLYEDEVFVFTPKGDLLKFPKGATVLDFAYHIHSNVGNRCIGARINGHNVSIRRELRSGDSVEIITSNSQKPRQTWLDVVKTSRARQKIRLALKETQTKEGQLAKEALERKFKNRKIEPREADIMALIKKMGFKEASEFYRRIAEGQIDTTEVIDLYVRMTTEKDHPAEHPRSADGYRMTANTERETASGEDVLVIEHNLKGVDYQLSKCCHPIYGDPVFAFVSVGGGIKIHRQDCPNAPELRRRFPYRIMKAKWSGKGSSWYSITLRVVGADDIGIVNNLTSVIAKEEHITLRQVNIDSHDGLFSGNLIIMLEDTSRLNSLIKKLKTVKGVKNIERI